MYARRGFRGLLRLGGKDADQDIEQRRRPDRFGQAGREEARLDAGLVAAQGGEQHERQGRPG